MTTKDTVLFRLLGPFEMVIGEEAVPAGGPKQRAMLCYLTLHAGRPISLGTLAEAVWGDGAPDGATRSLRTYASNLRHLLGSAVELRGGQGTYTMDLRSVETDVDRFRALVADAQLIKDPDHRGAKLKLALDLWRGPFLADVDHTWVHDESVALAWDHRRTITAWADATIAAGHPSEVIAVLEHSAGEAPLDEQICGLLMRALYRTGRQSDALAAYRRLRDGLATELGIEPGPDLRAIEEQILVHEMSYATPLPWLPAPSADLVGRSVEVEELLERLKEGRLVTLTGPGGVGKTRLALELGRQIAEHSDQSVYFADLSTVFDESTVDAVLASSAGVQPHPDIAALTSLIEYLRIRPSVLIVDNCEHLAGAVARSLATLMRNCPLMKLVTTSRAPLHIDGELEWRTPSLPFPSDADMQLDDLVRWPAVDLLVRRAPNTFRLSETNRSDVVEMCRLLDGLPLAIELVAPRLGSMTPVEIIGGLGSREAIARPGESDDSRHATLEATIGWSYDLLASGPRHLLEQLGVMSGRFLFDDVVAVCEHESASPADMRGWMSMLVDQSLVMADTSGAHTRYRLLETIRRFALDELSESEPTVRQRHATHFGRVAESETARLVTPEEVDASDRLTLAYDNLRGAIEWAMRTGDVATATRIVASIPDWGYWRSRYELGRWAQWVWETTTRDDPFWRAVCGSAARGAWLDGRFEDAVKFATAAQDAINGVVLARSGYPSDVLADVALYRGDAESALEHYMRVADAASADEDMTRHVWADYYVSTINVVLGRSQQADEAAQRAMAGARETGNPTAMSFSLYAAGLAAKHSQPEKAMAMFSEAVRVADSVGNGWFGGIARMELASTRARHGDLDAALDDFDGVIDHWYRVGDDTQLRLALRYLVRVFVDLGLPDRAAVLTGALMFDTTKVLTHPRASVRSDLAAALGDAEYNRLTVRGSIMSVPELVAFGVETIDSIRHAIPQH